jgi:hypothetical protein
MCSASAGQGQLNHNAVHEADDDETGKTKEKRGVAGSASPNFFFFCNGPWMLINFRPF